MRPLFRSLDHCLLCGSAGLVEIAALGGMPVATPNFRLPPGGQRDLAERLALPLRLMLCVDCGQVQVSHVGDPDLQYGHYHYTTGLSLGLSDHFRGLADCILARLAPSKPLRVVEIGSNDGTLLRHFAGLGHQVQGVDPATEIAARASSTGIPTDAAFFGLATAQRLVARAGRAGLILANNVIANVHDMADFGAGIAALLDPNSGLFVFETQYGADVFDRLLLDTIYHEHLSYFMLRPIIRWAAAHGLAVVDAERIAPKGGSIRVYIRSAAAVQAPSARLRALVAEEEYHRRFQPDGYRDFVHRVETLRDHLMLRIAQIRTGGGSVAGFGVSVGTLALLGQLGLANAIDFLVDDDPDKGQVLSGPGYDIPILPTSALMERRPDLTVLFAWRYAGPILARHAGYRAAGGRFLIPLPELDEV